MIERLPQRRELSLEATEGAASRSQLCAEIPLIRRFYRFTPSVICWRKCHLPPRGRLWDRSVSILLGRVNDTLACWLASQYHSKKTIRLLPCRGNFLCRRSLFICILKKEKHTTSRPHYCTATVMCFRQKREKKEGKLMGMSCFSHSHVFRWWFRL